MVIGRLPKFIKATIIVCIFLLPLNKVWAEPSESYRILPLDSNFNASQMTVPGAVIDRFPTAEESEKWTQTPQVPYPDELKKVFAHAGLSEETSNMDQLDQDLFFERAIINSLSDFQKIYPKIPLTKLKELQRLAKTKSKPKSEN
jgi:hypothetical protein